MERDGLAGEIDAMSCLAAGSTADHLVILAPVSSSDSVSWCVGQLEGSKGWTREIRSRNFVSAAELELSDHVQTNCVPTPFGEGPLASLIAHSLAPSSFMVASDVWSFVLAVRRSSKEFRRAAKAFLKLWQKSSQSPEEARGAVFGAGGCFLR